MGKKILLVDDELEMLDFVAMRLEANGYEIHKAKNGLEGLEAVQKNKPDLIISDVLMPEMDGIAFCKELKKDKSLAEIPVVILTARGKGNDSLDSIGVKDIIYKPFKPEELLEKIKTTFDAPASKPAAPEKPAAPVSAPPSEAKAEKFGRILVAGSTEKITKKISKKLEEALFEVKSCCKGSDVLNLIQKFNPQVLIMDVRVDGIATKDIIVKLKKSKEFKKLPIVVFSYFNKDDMGGDSSHKVKLDIESSRTTCLDAGAKEFIGEYDGSTFLSSIKKYLPSRN